MTAQTMEFGAEAIEAIAPIGEAGAQPSRFQLIGNYTIHIAKNAIALGCTALAINPGTVAIAGQAEARGADEATPAEILATATHENGAGHKKSNSSHTGEEDDCVDITTGPYDYYIGQACGSDRIVELQTGHLKSFMYGAIVMHGKYKVYKCGWVHKGVVPTAPTSDAPHTVLQYCDKQYNPLWKNPYTIFKTINCKPGSCRDGYEVKQTPQCNDDLYADPQSKERSVTNVVPQKGQPSFIGFLGKQRGDVLYRGTVNSQTAAGYVAVVRSPEFGWATEKANCIPLKAVKNATTQAKISHPVH
jgi:hypothetical protein